MDDQSLARIDRLLNAYPAAWDDDPDLLDELLAAAATNEVAGTPVAQSNPQLAAYLLLHPEVAEEYAELVWLNEQPAAAMPDPAALQAILARLRPPAPQRRILPPQRLNLRVALRSTPNAPNAPSNAVRRFAVAVPERRLTLELELVRQDDLGALIVRLTPDDTAAQVSGATAQLFSTPPDVEPTLAAPLAQQALDADNSALFSELEPQEPLYLLVELAEGAPLLLLIEPDWWPL